MDRNRHARLVLGRIRCHGRPSPKGWQLRCPCNAHYSPLLCKRRWNCLLLSKPGVANMDALLQEPDEDTAIAVLTIHYCTMKPNVNTSDLQRPGAP